jgi:hypothetical protein
MSHEQKKRPSRMERQVRNLSRGLFWVSSGLLIVCMAMTGLFGWSIGTELSNKIALAVGYGAADAAGALFWAGSGVCFAWRARAVGVLSLVLGSICFAVSLSAVVGFQSANREAIAQARERGMNASTAYLDWSKTAVTDSASKAKGSGAHVLSGIEAVGVQVKEQIRMLNAGEIAAVSDGQAYTFAKMLGIKEVDARSWAIGGGSAALLLIQYGCLWLYGFFRHRLEPQIATWNAMSMPRQVRHTQQSRQSFDVPDQTDAMSEPDAREELDRLLSTGYRIDNMSFLARRFGWTTHKTARWLRSQTDIKVSPPGKRGERISVQVMNGNGRAHA